MTYAPLPKHFLYSSISHPIGWDPRAGCDISGQPFLMAVPTLCILLFLSSSSLSTFHILAFYLPMQQWVGKICPATSKFTVLAGKGGKWNATCLGEAVPIVQCLWVSQQRLVGHCGKCSTGQDRWQGWVFTSGAKNLRLALDGSQQPYQVNLYTKKVGNYCSVQQMKLSPLLTNYLP